MTSGAAEEATISTDIAKYITADMTVGSNLKLDGKRNINGVTVTEITSTEKQSSASSSNCISFNVTPANGLYFTPTNVKFIISRIGTDSGVFDLSWQNQSGTTSLVSGSDIKRNNESSGWYTDYSQDITDIAANMGENSLKLYLYNVNATKQTAIANVVIEGKVSQVSVGIKDVSNCEPATITYYNMQGIKTTSPKNGIYIKVMKYANGSQKATKVTFK